MVIDTYTKLIPVILMSAVILYSDDMAYIANTPLGKIIAILLIVYYSSMDIFYGIFMCSIVILYYSTNGFKQLDMQLEPFSIVDVTKQFKEQNCKNGELIHRGTPINLEMLEHIHPDLNFKYEKCNPCFDSCDFSIIEEQIKAEESLKPKTSDDFSLNKLIENISDYIPALWVKTEPFAQFE